MNSAPSSGASAMIDTGVYRYESHGSREFFSPGPHQCVMSDVSM